MKTWTKEEIQFVKEYFKDYPTKELAEELHCSIKNINDLAKQLNLIDSIPNGFKKCKDCNEVKSLSEFYKRNNEYPNSYCKVCDNIRRRNHTIMKKIKAQIELDLNKINISNTLKTSTENVYFECTKCRNKKLGSNFYFDSSILKRKNICIDCEKQIRENAEIQKIRERGY